MDMPPREVSLPRLEYVDYDPDYKHVGSGLYSLKEQCKVSNSRAAEDMAALVHDRNFYPKAIYNHRGEPVWPGSAAEKSLFEDIDNGKHNEMKPRDLHQSRMEYQVYPLTVFRGHIHQEVKKRKFINFLKSKQAAKEKKEAAKKR